jgi:hypothetical protein
MRSAKVRSERETPHWCDNHRGSNVLRRNHSGPRLFGFFFVAVMGMSGGDAGQPTSVAIAGMGIAGGCSLLILASVTVCLAIGVLKLREWAWIVSIASNAVGIGSTILSLFAFKEYRVLPLVPSIVFHLLVVSTGVWMLAYLLLPRVKQAFSAATA